MRWLGTMSVSIAVMLTGCGGGNAGAGLSAEGGASSSDATVSISDAGPPIEDSGRIARLVTCLGPIARASASLHPVGDPGSPDSGTADSGEVRPLVGNAAFATTSTGVDLTISVTGCAGVGYPVRILEGQDCSDVGLQSPDWDTPRGENISSLHCTSASGGGLDYYTRPTTDAKPWTIGGPLPSNLESHVIVLDDPSTMHPLACGKIVIDPTDGDAGPAIEAAIPATTLAQLSGIFLIQMGSFGDAAIAGCPDPEKVASCSCAHCNLSACLPACSDYVACLQQQPDSCTSACALDPACGGCLNNITQCMLSFCADELSCVAPPVPGGPCDRLEACCATQRDGGDAPCLSGVHLLEKFGGDVSCASAMHDWDFVTHAASNPPCDFDQ